MGDICNEQKHDGDVSAIEAFGTVSEENFSNLDLMSRHSQGAFGGPYLSLAGGSAEGSWMSCHTETAASLCPRFHLRDCLLLPQNCLCPDSTSQSCSSPHHVFKLSGLHFDKYSSGNSITVSHSKNNCSHLWSASEKIKKNTKLYCTVWAPSGEDINCSKSVINYIS